MSTEFFDINGIKVANIKNNSGIAFFGIAVLAGSNYETREIAGISHFAEHLFFKGTETRNWHQINQEFAKLGVINNAYTCNNDVIYFSACPKENIEPVIDLMLDMFFHSTIPEEELEKERGVIVEEKKMYDDDPKCAFSMEVKEKFFVWEKGHDELGTFETINAISRNNIIKFLEDRTNLSNMIFVCCGDIDTDDLKKYISKNIPSDHIYLRPGSKNVVTDKFFSDIINKPDKIKLTIKRKNIAQANVSMITRGLAVDDDLYLPSAVVYKALGGGMYSKLFERIREELGLCYSVGIYNLAVAYPCYTMTDLYGYTSPENVDLFIEESEKVIKRLIKDGLEDDLFECAKTQLLSDALTQMETSQGCAMFLAKKYLDGNQTSIETIIEKIRAIQKKTCNDLIDAILDVQYNWAIMIPEDTK